MFFPPLFCLFVCLFVWLPQVLAVACGLFLLLLILFVCFWLCWVSVAAQSFIWLRHAGFCAAFSCPGARLWSRARAPYLWPRASLPRGRGVFPDPCLLRWQAEPPRKPQDLLRPLCVSCRMRTECSIKVCEINERMNEWPQALVTGPPHHLGHAAPRAVCLQ